MTHYGVPANVPATDAPIEFGNRTAYTDGITGNIYYLETVYDELAGTSVSSWYDSPDATSPVTAPTDPLPITSAVMDRIPLGAKEVTSEGGLNPPTGANLAEMVVKKNHAKGIGIYYRTQGGTASADNGFAVAVEDRIELESSAEITGFNWVNIDSSKPAKLYAEFFYNFGGNI